MKRITAYIFLLLANFVLLGHAVIPHHHHHRQVCILSIHCQSDALAHEHSDHEHDGAKSDGCALKQAVILPVHQGKQLNGCLDCVDNHLPDFQCTLLELPLDIVFVSCVAVPATNEITRFYSTLLQSSSGLRGPPTV